MNNLNILFVDDGKEQRHAFRRTLERMGHVCDTADNGYSALEKDLEKFDVIITDIAMPEMDGIELTRDIRKTNTKIPIIGLTGFSELFKTEEELQSSGFDMIANKPITKDQLAQIIKDVLRRD